MVANDDEMVTTDASFDKTRPCVVCGSAKVEDEDLIVVCDNQACDVYVHQLCYCTLVPTGNEKWFCDSCRANKDPTTMVCRLCGKGGPDAYKLLASWDEESAKNEMWCHMVCSYYNVNTNIENPESTGTPIRVIDASLFDKEQCSYCKSSYGLLVQCCASPGKDPNALCKRRLHVTCAMREIITQKDGTFKFQCFCDQHASYMQNKPERKQALTKRDISDDEDDPKTPSKDVPSDVVKPAKKKQKLDPAASAAPTSKEKLARQRERERLLATDSMIMDIIDLPEQGSLGSSGSGSKASAPTASSAPSSAAKQPAAAAKAQVKALKSNLAAGILNSNSSTSTPPVSLTAPAAPLPSGNGSSSSNSKLSIPLKPVQITPLQSTPVQLSPIPLMPQTHQPNGAAAILPDSFQKSFVGYQTAQAKLIEALQKDLEENMKLHIAMTSAAAVAAAIPPPQPVPLRSPSPPSGGETASSGEVTKMRTELAAKNRSLREARDKIKELTESNDKIKKTLEDDQRNREFRFNAVNRNLKEVCIDLGVIFKILKLPYVPDPNVTATTEMIEYVKQLKVGLTRGGFEGSADKIVRLAQDIVDRA